MGSGPYDDVLAQGRRGTIRVVLVGSAAVVALVLAVAGLVAWAGLGTAPGTAAGGPTTPPVAEGSTSPPTPDSSMLATPALDVAMPDDLDWRDLQGVALPYSASKGPTDTLGGLASGFAHDPSGAVLAAAHIIIRINPQVGPSVFEPTLREQVIGPEVAALRETIVTAYATLRQQAGVSYGDPAGEITATLLGFRVENYTDTDTDVRLITEGPDSRGATTTTGLRLHMRWSGDDWVLAFPAGADLAVANLPVDETSIYTAFAGR